MASRIRDLEEAKLAFARRDSKESILAHSKKRGYTEIDGTVVPGARDRSDSSSKEAGHSDAGDYVKSLVFGGLDGTVTTFTLVCAAIGGGYRMSTLITLGVAKVLSDAISMGLGDAVSEMAEMSFVKNEKAREKWEMETYLEGEIEEMVELYVSKGFKENDARSILELMVAKNPEFFLNHMLVQELGLMPPDDDNNPLKKGAVMFSSFLVCGLLVIFPFAIIEESGELDHSRPLVAYVISVMISIIVLGSLGAYKASITRQERGKGALQYIGVGCLSAATAFFVSSAVKRIAP